MVKNKLLLLLVLLVAVSGAWAADGIECSASDKGKVICTDGSIYENVSAATTAGKTAVAMIAYIDMENKNGLALALSDEGSMTWSEANSACAGKSAVAGGTWVLPSKEQWEAMGAKESNSTSATALRDGFSSVGGTNMQSGAYWSSTENSTNVNKAYRYYFTNGYYWENNVNKTVNNYVRACLTFNILVAPPTYSVTLAEGTEDSDNWTISPAEAAEGDKVTVTYSGEKKVKSVKAVKKAAPITDLATITADYEAKDGETLTGTLASNVKISIAAGATVTLKDVTITNLGINCNWAGINCPGDATLVLEGTNTVCAGRGSDGYNNYPGIWIAPDKTLTIQGDGTLTAYGDAESPYAAGIGGGYKIACGNIVINSGTITATGGWDAAGIGGGLNAGCGNITINGGTVTATGGNGGAGIGGGAAGTNYASCGNITISGGTVEATGGKGAAGIGGGNSNGAYGTITITKGVTSVKATKGEGAESIGKGNGGQDITVNIENGANVTQK